MTRTLFLDVFLVLLTGLMASPLVGVAQPLVFAHNDYEKPQPLTNALAARADFIEADVFLRGGR